MTLALYGGRPEVTLTPDFGWPRYRDDDFETMLRYAREGAVSFGLDPRPIRTLEAVAGERLQSRHCLAVSSGTAALHCAFLALEAGPGVEVLCPNYTFYRSVTPLVVLGATPVLVDSEPDLENVDAGRLERFVTPATEGIVVTHMVGHPCDLESVWAVADRHGLWVVEDAAQAHGAMYRDQVVGGGRSEAVCFSMQGHKVINAGQGGLLCTPRRDVYERALLFGYGSRVTHESFASDDLAEFASGWGLNYQINSLGAALATGHLRRLPEIVAARSGPATRSATGWRASASA